MDSCQAMEPYNKLNYDTHSILHVKQCIICVPFVYLIFKVGKLYSFHNFSVLFTSFNNNTFLLDGFCGFLNAVILTGYDFHYILFTTRVIQAVLKDLLLTVHSNVHHKYHTFPASLWNVVCASSEINSRFSV